MILYLLLATLLPLTYSFNIPASNLIDASNIIKSKQFEKSNFDVSEIKKFFKNDDSYNPTYSVGIIGATGAVGQEIINCLHKTQFPVSELNLYTSKKSSNKIISTPFGRHYTKEFEIEHAKECNFLFLAVSGDFSKKNAVELCEKGAFVIDNSSAFRYDDNVPLVIPEINKHKIKGKRLIANPNCTTAIALMALFPIFKLFGLTKVIMSTYQAASGAGSKGIIELEESLKDKNYKNEVFTHPLAFNVIPHIDKFQDNKYTKEEMKVSWEIQKILEVPNLPVSCTAVRIPTIRAHSEAVTVETEKPIDYNLLKTEFDSFSGLKVVDNPEKNIYPMPLTASESYDVEVGRIRPSLIFGDFGLDMFICGDQLLRGAALNAVLIAKSITEEI